MSLRTNIGPPPLPEGYPSFYDSADYREAQDYMLQHPEIAGWVLSDFSWRFYDQHRPPDFPSAAECKAQIAESYAEQDRQEAEYESRQKPGWFRNLFGGWL